MRSLSILSLTLFSILPFGLAAGCGDDDDDEVTGDGDADIDGDADSDSDADTDADGDADDVCEDLVNDCGYDPGCNGEIGTDGCICSRDRPQQIDCLPDATQTTCDVCVSFGSVPWFCAEIPGTGWRWQRVDDVAAWTVCTEEQRCALRNCHGTDGLETWVCNGTAWLPVDQVPEC